ncbi:MAG: metalloprotease PmbA [Gammaproteobacteria bacterium]
MNTISDIKTRQDKLQQLVDNLLAEAKKQGATSAEAAVSSDSGLAVTVRMGDVETIVHTRDNGLGISVYFGQRKGSASTSDLSPQAVIDTVKAACSIARYTSEDECTGLADPELMAKEIPDLDLYHPWPIEVNTAIELGKQCEAAALSYAAQINNSEGASLTSHSGLQVYGNSHGFIGGYPSSRHSLSCSVIAQDDQGMQRDYWYTSGRAADDLEAAETVGHMAGKRALARLGSRKIGTREAPILFQADMAVGLMRSLVSAISGSALYRQSSFLLDHLGKQIFPEFVRIHEDPLLRRGLASAPFDSEGVATQARDIVDQGILQSYILSSYSARKLGMQTTGNAGGVRNLAIQPGELDLPGMLQRMGTGLLVTELMGHGTNMVTGDYSRGAAGFWVENGEIQHPVEEITIAGNLKQMFRKLVAVGNDIDQRYSVRTGSWLIESMTIAGE